MCDCTTGCNGYANGTADCAESACTRHCVVACSVAFECQQKHELLTLAYGVSCSTRYSLHCIVLPMLCARGA
jgi:hypothetical protein